MKNKSKLLFFVIVTMSLFISMSLISATDVADNTQTSDIQSTDIQQAQTSITQAKSTEKTVSDNTLSERKSVVKQKNIKKDGEPKTIVLNNDTFDEYLSDTQTVGTVEHHYFNDEVNDGDTIDIQGKITDRTAFHITVNKTLHFITSTNDGEFDFGGAGQIIFNNNASGSSIEGLTLRNCQFTTSNASDITINNITALNIGQAIGNGVGAVSIRDGSQNITVTNSYFLSQNNGGHSNFVYAVAYNCLLENNTIESIGSSGNILYFTTYNVFAEVPIMNSVNITVRNNTIRGTGTPTTGICVGLMLSGFGHIIENNLVEKNDYIMGIQWYDPGYEGEGQINGTQIGDIIFRNNTIYGNDSAGLGIHGIVTENTFYCAATISGPKVYNNTFQSVKIENGVTFENNTLKADLNPFYNNTVNFIVDGNNTTVNNVDGTIDNFSIRGSNNTISNITVDTTKQVLVNGTNNILTDNNIKSTQRFAVEVIGENNTITENNLEAETLKGNVAVKYTQGRGTIENNTPLTQAQNIFITEENYSDYFDNQGNIIVSIPDESIITFQANFTDKDFVLDNINAVIVADNLAVCNSTFTFGKNATLIMDGGFNINNTISDKKTALVIEADNMTFERMDVSVDGTASDIVAIKITGNNNAIESYVRLYDGVANQENPGGIGFLIESANNTIINRFVPRSSNATYTSTVLTETSNNNLIRETSGIIISGNNNVVYGGSLAAKNTSPAILNNANNTTLSISSSVVDYPAILVNNSNNNIIENCYVTSSGLEYTIHIVNNSNNNIIRNNSITNNQTYGGDDAVYIDETSLNNTVFKNSLTLVKLDDETYPQLFTDGIWNDDYSAIQLVGDLHNKNLTFRNTINIDGNGYTIYNGTITTTTSGFMDIQNVKINNTNGNPGIISNGIVNFINNTVSATGDNITVVDFRSGSYPPLLHGINNNTIIGCGDNIILLNMATGAMTLKISNNTLTATGDNVIGVNFKVLNMQTNFTYNNITINTNKSSKAVLINGSSSYDMIGPVNMTYNNYILNTDESSTVIEVIPMTMNINLNYCNYTVNSNASSFIINVKNTNLAQTYNFSYCNVVINSDNATTALKYVPMATQPTISYNNFTVNTNQSTNLISFNNMISSGKIQYNTIIINTTQGSVPIINATMGFSSQITDNYIESLDVVGDDAIKVNMATLRSNTPTRTTGYKAQLDDITLPDTIISNYDNQITVTPTDSFANPVTGTITLTDGETTTTSDTNTITYTPTTDGEKTLTITYTDPTGKYNTTTTTIDVTVTPQTLVVDPITITLGQTADITARLTTEVETLTDINTGKVAFKVNGKILRDSTTGKVLYVDVENGVATLTGVTTNNWEEDTEISAIYLGSTSQYKLTSEVVNPTITQPEDQPQEFSLDDVTSTAGNEVTITVTTKNLDTGKVVLKVNGKTVKVGDGKLYAKTSDDSVTFTYTVPKTLKAGEYSIKAVYTSGTSKLEAESKLTVE